MRVVHQEELGNEENSEGSRAQNLQRRYCLKKNRTVRKMAYICFQQPGCYPSSEFQDKEENTSEGGWTRQMVK